MSPDDRDDATAGMYDAGVPELPDAPRGLLAGIRNGLLVVLFVAAVAGLAVLA